MALPESEQMKALIRERAERSGLYKRLDETGRLKFEAAVETYATTVLSGADTRTIKNEWKMAAMDAGAEEWLTQSKAELTQDFGVGPGAFNPAIRNTARDVLHVIVSPRAHRSIADLFKIRQRAQHTHDNEIAQGRQFETRESQPPSTGARTLRRRN